MASGAGMNVCKRRILATVCVFFNLSASNYLTKFTMFVSFNQFHQNFLRVMPLSLRLVIDSCISITSRGTGEKVGPILFLHVLKST